MSAERRKRLLRILELISMRAIRTQEELVEALRGDGWDVTQSSVSRDITALRLVKSDGIYRRPPSRAASSPDPDRRRVAEDVIAMETAGEVLIVLHTPAGEASAVGLALDHLSWPDIIGTIAGDDTIFVATKDAAGQRRVMRELRRLVASPLTAA
jgi:transcriptional regulator of arginine metabolism